MRVPFYLLAFPILLGLAACGEEEPKKPVTKVVVEPTPKDAVAEVKLQLEDFRTYYYCEKTYPQECDELPHAYVLPREGDEPFKVVFFNNQDRRSTPEIYDYLTVDMETKTIQVEGQFKVWVEYYELKKEGTPLWGIPE